MIAFWQSRCRLPLTRPSFSCDGEEWMGLPRWHESKNVTKGDYTKCLDQ